VSAKFNVCGGSSLEIQIEAFGNPAEVVKASIYSTSMRQRPL